MASLTYASLMFQNCGSFLFFARHRFLSKSGESWGLAGAERAVAPEMILCTEALAQGAGGNGSLASAGSASWLSGLVSTDEMLGENRDDATDGAREDSDDVSLILSWLT